MLWLFVAAWPLFSAAQNLQVSLPDYTVCEGGSVTLIPQVSGGTPPYTYVWSPAASLSCADCANPIAMPPQTTVYSLTVTDSADEEATAAIMVTVGINSVTQLPPVTLCIGDCYSVGGNLYCSPGTYDIPLQSSLGCDSIVRLTLSLAFPQQTVINPTICQGNSFSVGNEVLTQTGAYNIPLLSTFGCDSIVTVNLTVTPGVTVSLVSSVSSVCVGGWVTLTATATGGMAGCTYQWQISGAEEGPWTTLPNVTNSTYSFYPGSIGGTQPSAFRLHRVIYTCPDGSCSADTSNTVTVTFFRDPSVVLTPANNIACIGDVVRLKANTSGGTGDCSIQWRTSSNFNGPWMIIPGATDSIYEAPSDVLGTRYYIANFACSGVGCDPATSSFPAKVVIVEQAPITSITPAQSTLCAGEPATLTSAVVNGADTCVIQWQSAPSPEGPWLNIIGANGVNYNPQTDSLSTTTHFRAQYSCEGIPVNTDPLVVSLAVANTYNLSVGEKFCVDIIARDSMSFFRFQLGIDFDPTKLKFVSAQNLGFPGMTFDSVGMLSPGSFWLGNPGLLGVFWPDINPQIYATSTAAFSAGSTMLSLCFEVLNGGSPTSIGFSPIFTQFYRTYPLASLFKLQTVPGVVTFEPNCFSSKSNISSLTVQASSAIAIDTADFGVCIGAPVSIHAAVTGATDSCTVQWQSAPAADGPWSDIPDADSLSYQAPTDQTGTAYYRAILSCPGICAADTSNVATVIVLEEMTMELTVTAPLCPGDLGSIQVQGNPTVGDFTFTWSTGLVTTGSSSQTTLGGLQAGTYCVTMTANNGCAQVVGCEFIVPDPLVITIMPDITSASCASTYDGAIAAIVFGGTPPYTYLWSNASSQPNGISMLPAGTYGLTVVDANGCLNIQTYTIGTALTADAGPNKVINCISTTATLQGSASLSGPNIEYAWYGPGGTIISNQATVTVSEGGLYRFRAVNTDVPDCFSEDEMLVSDISGILIQDMTMTLVACNTWRLSGIIPPTYFGQIDFEWTFPDGSMSTGLFITTTGSGVYQLRISIPGAGCEVVVARFIDADSGECAVISGRVAYDTNEDCTADANEAGLAGWLVRAVSNAGIFYAITDGDGAYHLSLPLGNYALSTIPPSASWALCTASYPVALIAAGQMNVRHIPAQYVVTCPELDVQLSTSFLRRCFTNNYFVKVCNTGTETVAAPLVTLVLDDFLEFQNAQLPPQSVDGQTLTWTLQPLAPGQCRQFWVNVRVSCDALLGQAHCSTVTATPDVICTPASADWSGASLEITGECTGNEAVFRVRNTGAGDLTESVQYIVIEDVVMLMQLPNTIENLPSGEEEVFEFPANGATWFFALEQAPNHPFSTVVTAALEGCGTNEQGTFSTGFVNQLPLQTATPAIHILCMPNVGAYDPNDKQAIPVGYGTQHFIHAGDPIQYKIRFQNTGTDTAFTVIIRDTLSPWLDITTLRPGPSSHQYRLDIAGERTLVFTFDNILLPDSTTNLDASQGFVDFFIHTADSIPLLMRIENSAAIYFDFNEPIITNTVFHTIGRDFFERATATFYPPALRPQWRVFPNPTSDEAILVLEEAAAGVKTAWLYDAFGRQVLRLPFEGDQCLLQLAGMAPGWYALRVTDAAGRSLGTGRVVLR